MKPIGVYIHMPFCVRKCRYCDFVSYPLKRGRVEDYFEALVGRELPKAAEMLSATGRRADTLYIGGGTPTAIPQRCLVGLLGECLRTLPISAESEVTVEANPGTLDKAYAYDLLAAGATRLSIGVQSLNDRTLGFLGRIHTAQEAEECIQAVRGAGFRNVNLDLIYGTPAESLGELMTSVEKVVSLGPEHVAVYGLSIAEGTPLFEDVASGKVLPTPDDEQRRMYEAVRERLSDAGYVQYEISNWARPGFESRHNLNYWRCGEYLGLGCAASSHIDGARTRNVDHVARYVRLLRAGKMPVRDEETLTRQQRLDEAIMLGLRMREGLNLAILKEREGLDLLSERSEQIEKLHESRLIELDGDWLRLTDDGVLVADEVIVWLA